MFSLSFSNSLSVNWCPSSISLCVTLLSSQVNALLFSSFPFQDNCVLLFTSLESLLQQQPSVSSRSTVWHGISWSPPPSLLQCWLSLFPSVLAQPYMPWTDLFISQIVSKRQPFTTLFPIFWQLTPFRLKWGSFFPCSKNKIPTMEFRLW